jgi:hypothetical protein
MTRFTEEQVMSILREAEVRRWCTLLNVRLVGNRRSTGFGEGVMSHHFAKHTTAHLLERAWAVVEPSIRR